MARKLFEALRLEVHYDKIDSAAVRRIRLSGETPAVQQTGQESGAVIPFKTPTRGAKTSSNRSDLWFSGRTAGR